MKTLILCMVVLIIFLGIWVIEILDKLKYYELKLDNSERSENILREQLYNSRDNYIKLHTYVENLKPDVKVKVFDDIAEQERNEVREQLVNTFGKEN